MAIPIPQLPPSPVPDGDRVAIGLYAEQGENGMYRGLVRVRKVKDGVLCEQDYPCGEERDSEQAAHTDALLLSLRLPE